MRTRYVVGAILLFGLAGCDTGHTGDGDDPARGPIGEADLVGSCLVDEGASGDRCGGQSDGSCYCDDECLRYGDCCQDKPIACDGVELVPEGACAAENVVSIQRPVLPDEPAGASFTYRFQVWPGTDPNAGTVIYLPGGPGGTAIAENRDLLGFIPEEVTLIFTDPRGVGCNRPGNPAHYPEEFYQSRYLASDIVAIVEHLQLDSYLLYGHSYGTLLATESFSAAQQASVPLPEALVLEGVLGTWFEPGEVEAGYVQEWNVVRANLPQDLQDLLESGEPPLGLDTRTWGTFIQNLLMLGATDDPTASLLAQSLPALAGSEAEQEDLREFVGMLGEPEPADPNSDRMYQIIACSEVAKQNDTAFDLVAGELVTSNDLCSDRQLTDPYDAMDHPISVPIYYFNGHNDPSTPMWQANAHFDNQEGTERYLVEVTGAGHMPFSMNLGDSCGPALWNAMLAHANFELAVQTCTWPVDLRVGTVTSDRASQ